MTLVGWLFTIIFTYIGFACMIAGEPFNTFVRVSSALALDIHGKKPCREQPSVSEFQALDVHHVISSYKGNSSADTQNKAQAL